MLGDTLAGWDRPSFEMHLEAAMEQVWKSTLRPWSSELGDALWGRDGASLEIQLEAVIFDLRDRNCAILKIHLEAAIERGWICTWRPWLSEIGGVIEGDQSGGGSLGGRRDGNWDTIHWLTHHCRNVENSVQHGLPRDKRLAGSGRQSMWRWCSMLCMQYSVYVALGVCCSQCMMYSVLTPDYGMER